MLSSIEYFFKRKFKQIKNLIKWFPIIWNQYDFDYSEAVKVFSFQLEKLANFLDSKHAHTESAKSTASSIRRWLKLMEKVQNEDFATEYQEKFKQKYGETKFVSVKISDTLVELVLIYPKVEGYTEDQIEDIYRQMFYKSVRKQRKAELLVWKLLANHMNGWWD